MPAPSSADGSTQCLYAHQIERVGYYTTATDRYFQASGGRIYRVNTSTDCFTPETRRVRIEPYMAQGTQLCPNQEVRVTMTVADLPRVCIARLSARVTDRAELRVSGLGVTRGASGL